MHCSRKPIRPSRGRKRILTGALVLLAGSLGVSGSSAQRRDYFTELEINDIQVAQEIDDRTQVLLTIAARRLQELSPPDPDAADAEDEDGFGATIGDALFRILAPEAAAEIEELEDARAALDDDLSGHSRSDLFRGYVQALEETMDNIDDAWERDRGDVRAPIEALRDFSQEALDRLRHLETTSDGEARALDEAVEQTQLVIDGSSSALETISN
jgi:hypothetical protein